MKPAPRKWYILGFSFDDVVCHGTDARLAELSALAWARSGRPASFQILQSSGGGEGPLIRWFVSEESAALLDSANIAWRLFLINESPHLPADAVPALELPN